MNPLSMLYIASKIFRAKKTKKNGNGNIEFIVYEWQNVVFLHVSKKLYYKLPKFQKISEQHGNICFTIILPFKASLEGNLTDWNKNSYHIFSI